MTVVLLVHDNASPKVTAQATKKITVKHVAVAPQPVTQLAPAKAAVCGDKDAGIPCSPFGLLMATEQVCDVDEPYAMTTIARDRGVPNRVYKYCANEAKCYLLWFQGTSDKSVCMNFDPQADTDLDCHFCCWDSSGSGACNVDFIPPLRLQYRP